jgi:hypothetical protein
LHEIVRDTVATHLTGLSDEVVGELSVDDLIVALACCSW